MDIRKKVNSLPLTSGVYLMRNADGTIIYVGKAVSLRKRVQSYFRLTPHQDSKTTLLVKNIHDIEYIETASEAEALILEASLIKEHTPKYNIELRDDKSYPLIEISHDLFPRISIERPAVRKKDVTYYGPYVSAGLIREALTIIRKIFHFRTCHPFPNKECLDYHMGLCDAPCIQKISTADYAKNIRRIRFILEGKKDELYRNLRKEMEDLSFAHRFEEAAKVRDQLQAIGALYSGSSDINYYKEAEQLQRALNLPRMPQRIETFDISNIMGNQAVGSMVSFLNGKPDKSHYRRFRIKEVKGIDDFKMIGEIVKRRYRRLKNEGKPYPDLIVIDGGKGQLSAAVKELQDLQIDIPIISLAKREEEVFLPHKKNPIRLNMNSLGLQLLQHMRDEAHRFAISYHRVIRRKAFLLRRQKAKKLSL
jgi:excinuclease ABC subunit C